MMARAVILLILLSTSSVSAEVEYSRPEVVLSLPEGTGPGELGSLWLKGGVPPPDFIVDFQGNYWILDGMNRRLQKYDRDGRFLLSWADTAGWEISYGSMLEMDRRGFIYVVSNSKENERRVNKLDSVANVVHRIPLTRHGGYFRVTASGELYVFDGLDAIGVGADGTHEDPVRFYDLFVTPFADHMMVGSRQRGRYEYFSQLPVSLEARQWVSLNTTGIESASELVEITLIDGSGRIFALDVRKSERGPMRVFNNQGEYLGMVPDCPREIVRIPDTGDFYIADSTGNLYQLTMLPPEDRPSKQGYINIWRWSRVR